ncbi:hypothetical protein [Actinomadura sp. KC06]|nr:hypothetical protein [Actinomadura sp. KC06]
MRELTIAEQSWSVDDDGDDEVTRFDSDDIVEAAAVYYTYARI